MILKKGTVVLITTNEAPISIEKDGETLKTFAKGAIVFNEKAEPSIHVVRRNEIIAPEDGYRRAHLLLVVEEAANAGDVILVNNSTTTAEKDMESALKVIASTNRHLELPRFSKGFLEKYVETQGIHEVFVVYEETKTKGLVPKVNKNNIISLRREKLLYNKEEMLDLFDQALSVLGPKNRIKAKEKLEKII